MQDWRHLHPQFEHTELTDNVPPSPWELWSMWTQAAEAHLQDSPLYINEIAIATCGKDLIPSVRMVLLKEVSPERGFCWYTNRKSEKGVDLSQNPRAEILWYFVYFHQQIRIKGTVSEVSQEQSVRYAQSRPLKSQLSAYISQQSRSVKSKQYLNELYKKEEEKIIQQGTCPVPSDWTGYSLSPTYFEFWQGRPDRLHDRITYTQTSTMPDSWHSERLFP